MTPHVPSMTNVGAPAAQTSTPRGQRGPPTSPRRPHFPQGQFIEDALTTIRSELDMYRTRALHYRMRAAEFGVESAMAAGEPRRSGRREAHRRWVASRRTASTPRDANWSAASEQPLKIIRPPGLCRQRSR